MVREAAAAGVAGRRLVAGESKDQGRLSARTGQRGRLRCVVEIDGAGTCNLRQWRWRERARRGRGGEREVEERGGENAVQRERERAREREAKVACGPRVSGSAEARIPSEFLTPAA